MSENQSFKENPPVEQPHLNGLADNARLDKFVESLSTALSHTVNEIILLNNLEDFFSPKPSKLYSSNEDGQNLQTRIDSIVERLGGAPDLIIQSHDSSRPKYDTFQNAVMYEVITSYQRCRKAICRAHLYFVGSEVLRTKPEFIINFNPNLEENRTLMKYTEEAFWEHAELAYIKLASYWDRIGQLLDSLFFNIRQYEKDGFLAVISRIRNNYIPMYIDLSVLSSWINLDAFSKSEKEDGMKWLSHRRNLIIHSLQLQPAHNHEDNVILDSEFNHLDKKLREKLSPGNAQEELNRLHGQLNSATLLFPDILNLCEWFLQKNLKR
jgi:hypothetical protein